MIDLEQIEDDYKELIATEKYLRAELNFKKRSLSIVNVKIKNYEEVHAIWLEIANSLQRKIRTHIEQVVSLAIQSVFQKPYQFKLIFKELRNNATCTPVILDEYQNEYSPKDSMGGAMLDIIGFAFRITLWAMQSPRSRNILILDEPFRFCGDLTLRTGMMVKSLLSEAKIQAILVTHNPDLADICDKVWSITNKNFSRVKMIDKNMRNFKGNQ